IELPVFPAYALGGGLGTKAAATNLARPSTPWFANTYKNWFNGGGNGAAMRIQPHVWAAHAHNSRETMMRDVLRNTVCSHAHPIAILGAYLHATSVDFALSNRVLPTIDDVAQFLADASQIVDVMDDDRDGLRNWKAAWQSASSRSFASSWNDVVAEIGRCTDAARRIQPEAADYYPDLLRTLGLFDSERRGSGAHTALAAVLLASWSAPPSERIEAATRAVGSDTDTIATMAGAILGCVADVHPHGEVLDSAYIEAEVERISGFADATAMRPHHYPDLLTWSAPRTQADALCLDGDQLHVAGLGDVAETLSDPMSSQDGRFAWQWVRLEIGQTLLVKRRPDLEQLAEGNRTSPPARYSTRAATPASVRDVGVSAAAINQAPTLDSGLKSIDLDEVLTWLEGQDFDDKSIGFALRRMAVRGTPAQTASFLAILLDRLSESGGSSRRGGR
ncbi:MAG: ADP-ribosylglycohydrolase family protein, partial [Ilumatobacter sp.]